MGRDGAVRPGLGDVLLPSDQWGLAGNDNRAVLPAVKPDELRTAAAFSKLARC